MGIKDLMKLIQEHAPNAVKEGEMKNYFGRKIAIDASMALYQFMIAVRQDGDQLTNDAGEVTSHLLGMFYRTLRMVDNGIKPLWIFDGKPPDLKTMTLEKRKERREGAEKDLDEAKELGEAADVEKFSRRLVRVTKEHNDEAKKLLGLMGMPFIESPSEAEAQCAELTRSGKVFGTATEDMDALTFNSPILLRHTTVSESAAKKYPVQEIHLERVLAGFEMTMDQFIDLCILLGCDYCDSIKGIGPKKAFDLMKKHGSIEAVLQNLDQNKYPVPDDWPYQVVREYFKNPEVTKGEELTLKWGVPDEDGLVQYLVTEKGFAEDRVRKNMEKLRKKQTGPAQARIDSFFKTLPSQPKPPPPATNSAKKEPASSLKRKEAPVGKNGKKSSSSASKKARK